MPKPVAMVVRRLDSAAAGDGGARFAVCFMLVVSCAPGVKSAINDYLIIFVLRQIVACRCATEKSCLSLHFRRKR